MTRPRRLYQEGGNYYYLVGGAKKKIKVPDGISQKQLQKINIKNIINLAQKRRVKKRKNPINVRYGKKIVSQMEAQPLPQQPGLSTYLFKPRLAVKTLDELAQSNIDTDIDKLAKQLLSRLQPVVTPPTVSQPVEIPPLPPALPGVTTSIASEPTESEVETESVTGSEASLPTSVGEEVSTDSSYVPSSVSSALAPSISTKAPSAPSSTKTQASSLSGDLSSKASSSKASSSKASSSKASLASSSSYVPSSASSEATVIEPLYRQQPFSFADKNNEALIYSVLQEIQKDDSNFDIMSTDDYATKRDRIMDRISQKLQDMRRFPSRIIPPRQKTLQDIFNSARPYGRGDGEEEGLFNDEIENIAEKRIKNYVPVIASDEINTLSKYVKPGQKRFAFIINTNPSTSDGSGDDGLRPGHWRSIYINNDDDYPTVEYFDPLCEGRIPNDLLKVCMKIARKMNPEMMFKYKQNMLRRQSKLTSNCGYHALKFIDDRYHGVPYSDATGYTDYMDKLNQVKDDSRDGEKQVMKYIKKYQSYI